MLDGHLKDVQQIILRQRLENEARFGDHSRSRRDTMAETTQITNDANILSRLSAQLHHLNTTITGFEKRNSQPPSNHNNNPSSPQLPQTLT